MKPGWMVVAAALCACTKTAQPPDPLRFETRKFEKLLEGCGDKEKRAEPCVTFRVTWPEVVQSKSPDAARKINADIKARLQPKEAPPSFEAEAAAFIEDFQRFQKDFPGSGITYFVRRDAEVLYRSPTVICIQIDEDEFSGGAHPNSFRQYLNARPETGEEIKLEEILAAGAMAKLTAAVEKRFRSDKHLDSAAKLSSAGFQFPDDRFALAKTWGITSTGLVFYYNDYEIGPHALGTTTVTLGWTEAAPLLRSDAAVLPTPH